MFFKNTISELEKFFNFNDDNDIAVVFPGKKVFSRENGKNIDNHKYILRLNLSITEGYEKYVGTKTSLRVINNKLFYNRENNNYIKKFFINCEDKKFLIISPEKFSKERLNMLKNKDCSYHFYHSNFIHELLHFFILKFSFYSFNFFYNNLMHKKVFTLGILIVLILNYLRIKPKIYGLDLNEDMSQRSHYFIDKENFLPIGKTHDLKLERKILKSFEKKKLITICD